MSDISSSSDLLPTVESFPKLPGVYLMRDAEGTVIYVGKAKELRSRVKTYFLGGDGRLQLPALMLRVRAVENIVTENEEQALILERDLITKFKPRYNIKLKDDKAYLTVRVDTDNPWPRVELVRRREEDDARYFGPFSSGTEVRALLEIIRRVVPLRTCTDTVFYNRARPCLEYQIKRCAGPCCLPVDRQEYQGWLKQAMALLQGKGEKLIAEFRDEEQHAVEQLNFEHAATVRDRIEILESFSRGHSLTSWTGDDLDVFSLYREEGLVAVAVLKVRGGRIADNENFALSEVALSDDEVIEAVVTQFYEGNREVPAEIVLPLLPENLSMIQSALEGRGRRRPEFLAPQRGVRVRLLSLAETNARQFFSTKFNAERRYQEIATALAKTLKLRQLPRRIECIDISNFQGSDIVGAVVVFADGAPDRPNYRRYKITSKATQDDFAGVFEVVTRRLTRGKESGDLPDLLVIDGGPGQLAKALEARDALEVDLEIVALAKQRTESDFAGAEVRKSSERIYLASGGEPIELTEGAELTRFLTRLRDETHNTVITFHRGQRKKRTFRSVLDDVAGLGPMRRARLLKHFGATAQISQAEVSEVARVGRMPLPLAQKVLDFLARPPAKKGKR